MKNNAKIRIALTGFMGVGKSSITRNLGRLLRCETADLDMEIEIGEGREPSDLIENEGVTAFRRAETEYLRSVLADENVKVIALGGGAFTVEENRQLLKSAGVMTIWLDADFDHCWRNIKSSARKRPLARSREETHALFDERIKFYALADWHFVVRGGLVSHAIAAQIRDDVFG